MDKPSQNPQIKQDIKKTQKRKNKKRKRQSQVQNSNSHKKTKNEKDQQSNSVIVRTETESPITTKKYPKKKVVLLVGYLGANYQGLQRNKDATTIEDVLEKAIVSAGGISAFNAGTFTKVSWGRAARTDKGVSALGNCISLKLILLPDIIEKINRHLPPEIRVFEMERVSKRFSPKNRCDSRIYEYFIPTYVFKFVDKRQQQQPLQVFFESDFEFNDAILHKVNNTLQKYVGSHNFHNFTNSLHPKDPRCQRVIQRFECSTPRTFGNTQWVTITVVGQSFVLHQIRKMIGLMVPIVKGLCNESVIEKAYNPERKYPTPLAPGLGLVLAKCCFNYYNKSCAPHPPLLWTKSEEAVKQFKETVIIPYIVQKEDEEKMYPSDNLTKP